LCGEWRQSASMPALLLRACCLTADGLDLRRGAVLVVLALEGEHRAGHVRQDSSMFQARKSGCSQMSFQPQKVFAGRRGGTCRASARGRWSRRRPWPGRCWRIEMSSTKTMRCHEDQAGDTGWPRRHAAARSRRRRNGRPAPAFRSLARPAPRAARPAPRCACSGAEGFLKQVRLAVAVARIHQRAAARRGREARREVAPHRQRAEALRAGAPASDG
jgi:hypothetical protein